MSHEPLAGGRSGEEAASARRVTLRRAWRRSQLRRDLQDCGVVIGLLFAGLLCAVYRDEIRHLIHVLTGGNNP